MIGKEMLSKAVVLSIVFGLALLMARPLVSANSVNFQVRVVRSDFNGWAGFTVTVWSGGSQFTTGVTDSNGDVLFTLGVGSSYEFRAGFASTTATVSAVPAAVWVGVILMPAVRIDIKPESELNDVNLKAKGTLPIAILGCNTVDVTRIVPTSIKIGSVGLATRGKGELMYSFKDVNSDGHMDLIVHFDIQALVTANVLTPTTVSLTVTATLDDGSHTEGTDSVNIVS